MSIDTAAKRRSAIATRRLPWFRRFSLPAPDGTIDQGDRQQLALVYRGVESAAEVETHPGDATFVRSGVGAVSVSRTGPGSSSFTRSGPGAVTISRKQS